LGKYTFKYDEKGNLIEENDFNGASVLYNKFIFKYDEKGNMAENSAYNSTGLLYNKFTYTYDSKGNILEQTEFNGANEIYRKIFFKYTLDIHENWTKRIKYYIVGEKIKKPESIDEIKIEYY